MTICTHCWPLEHRLELLLRKSWYSIATVDKYYSYFFYQEVTLEIFMVLSMARFPNVYIAASLLLFASQISLSRSLHCSQAMVMSTLPFGWADPEPLGNSSGLVVKTPFVHSVDHLNTGHVLPPVMWALSMLLGLSPQSFTVRPFSPHSPQATQSIRTLLAVIAVFADSRIRFIDAGSCAATSLP